jgi:hypothetical protein
LYKKSLLLNRYGPGRLSLFFLLSIFLLLILQSVQDAQPHIRTITDGQRPGTISEPETGHTVAFAKSYKKKTMRPGRSTVLASWEAEINADDGIVDFTIDFALSRLRDPWTERFPHAEDALHAVVDQINNPSASIALSHMVSNIVSVNIAALISHYNQDGSVKSVDDVATDEHRLVYYSRRVTKAYCKILWEKMKGARPPDSTLVMPNFAYIEPKEWKKMTEEEADQTKAISAAVKSMTSDTVISREMDTAMQQTKASQTKGIRLLLRQANGNSDLIVGQNGSASLNYAADDVDPDGQGDGTPTYPKDGSESIVVEDAEGKFNLERAQNAHGVEDPGILTLAQVDMLESEMQPPELLGFLDY